MKLTSSLLLFLLSIPVLGAAEVEWHPDANMDSQLFPSMIIATATQRPADDDSEPDPEVLGDEYGSVGVSITTPTAGTKVQVTVLENAVMNRSSWSGVLEKAGTDYYVAPKINYKFERLRNAVQQVPLNVTFAVEADGKSIGEKTETITLRTINDCPFGVSDSEETIDPEDSSESETQTTSAAEEEETSTASDGEYTDLGWMFAAYVNENSPIVQKIFKEALATKIVNSFAGYQGDSDDVLRELFAVWTALQDRGIKYSNITTTAATSRTVYSQHVRFVDESVSDEQANCVDGSVLFSSILRKLGLRAFLVTVPSHMYMGVYLTPDGTERVALETTLLGGTVDDDDADEATIVPELQKVRESLEDETAEGETWKTFATAIAVGTQDMEKNAEKFEAGDDPQFQITDIDEARTDGIMPISYQEEH